MKGISRIDSGSTHGWFVRVYREGETHSKMFSDGKYGGKRAAQKAAREYREDYERLHPRRYDATRIRLKPQRNNTTGIVGVSETHKRQRNGKEVPCFSISWRPRRKVVRTKCFYHHHFDSREAALEAAAEFRRQKEIEILHGIEPS
jgi:hypothetical protein